jgi:hypothetical protein
MDIHEVVREDEPIGNIWFDKAEHLLGSPRNLHEDTVVNLQQTEEL